MRICGRVYTIDRTDHSYAEHVISKSLGNDDLVLSGAVCDACQRYFGKEVEGFVLDKTPIAIWRVLLQIRTKKGNQPSVDTRQPREEKGSISDRHERVLGISKVSGHSSTTPKAAWAISSGAGSSRNQEIFLRT